MAAALSLPALLALGSGYSDAVLTDGPLAYYRFNDSTQRSNINVNSGSLGTAGNATNLNGPPHPGRHRRQPERCDLFRFRSQDHRPLKRGPESERH